MLHMLGVDVGHDGNRRGQAVEGTVGLVRLNHHPLARTRPRVRSIGMNDTAVNHGRVKPALIQQCRNHGGCRGLAMRSGNRNVRFQPHQLGQHLCPPHHRQLPPPRFFQLGVALLDGRGNHHHRRLTDILGALALVKGRAKRDQPVGDLRRLRVRSLHAVAKRHQNFGNP
ncbi:hypothetical protein GALL_521240 [mine drainage metagenome]|uniref:Uncharacterized protein n=1 Tax=mine drainage metagenome TaxID=410659 RepID=A0A1J5PRW1_9ZZZZ